MFEQWLLKVPENRVQDKYLSNGCSKDLRTGCKKYLKNGCQKDLKTECKKNV
jgi:hypothetical protein